jgi:protein-disulfide isomerase
LKRRGYTGPPAATPRARKEDPFMPSFPLLRRFAALGAVGLALALAACGDQKTADDGEAVVGPPPGTVAGKIAGETVTVGDVDAWIKDQLFNQATRGKNPMKVYEVRNRALEQMANERAADAAAAKAGKDRETLMKEEVEKRAAVSDEEVQKYYDEHKDRFRNLPFEKVAPAVKRQLLAQRQVQAMQEYTKGLRDELGFENDLESPRFEIAADGPARGPADAPITLVEFSDYECPFCKAAEPVVKQVLDRYPTQVKLVYKNYPIDSHPKARPAAEAALCAEEQGRFWEFHEELFAKSPQLAPEQLLAIANAIGLDAAKYEECVKTRRFQAKVDADVAAGKKSGVAGTPAFFVNGVPLSGGRSVEDFAKVINAELARLNLPVPEPPPGAAQAPVVPGQVALPPGAPPPPVPLMVPNAQQAPAPPGVPAPAPVPPAAAPAPSAAPAPAPAQP